MLINELDSLSLQACLSCDKFEHIAALLESWPVKQHCTKKELESLIGTLHHLCKVIPQSILLLSAFWRDDHPIRLNREFHLDLSWSREFFNFWDGLRFLLSPYMGTIT